jgi:hypothetical protein
MGATRLYGVAGLPPSHKATAGQGKVTAPAQFFLLMLIIEDAVQILSPAYDADETANDRTASLYGAASKGRMTMNERPGFAQRPPSSPTYAKSSWRL